MTLNVTKTKDNLRVCWFYFFMSDTDTDTDTDSLANTRNQSSIDLRRQSLVAFLSTSVKAVSCGSHLHRPKKIKKKFQSIWKCGVSCKLQCSCLGNVASLPCGGEELLASTVRLKPRVCRVTRVMSGSGNFNPSPRPPCLFLLSLIFNAVVLHVAFSVSCIHYIIRVTNCACYHVVINWHLTHTLHLVFH